MVGKASLKSKRGVGIVEALVASAVLGVLLVALLNYQSNNRDVLLRIRGRDGAVSVAHNVMDSLNAVGLASVDTAGKERCVNADGFTKPPVSCGNDAMKINRQMEWLGTPGIVEHTMRVNYRVCVCIESDGYVINETSDYKPTTEYAGEVHEYAKRLDVAVQWRFKSTVQSITMTGVIR